MSEYDQQAKDFLDRFNLRLTVADGDGRSPTWKGLSGDHFRVTVARRDKGVLNRLVRPQRFAFDFWGSYHDMLKNRRPSPYDVLACISSDANMPETADEVADELGPMPPSQALAASRFGRRIRAFFEPDELEALQGIQ